MLGCWNSEVSRWYQGFRGCMHNLAEDKVMWWDDYSRVWTYQERQGHLFALSAYFTWSKVRNIPLNNIFSPDFLCNCKAEIVHWVFENKQLFKIVTNHGFCSLMKTRRPGYCLPSAEIASCDVWVVFVNVWRCIAKILQVSTIIYVFLIMNSPSMLQPLQEQKGVLSFTTDAWTSPNHKAYRAVMVHFENKGVPVAILLDIMELVHLHSGLNLAAAFARILEDFGIDNKVSNLSCGEGVINSLDMCRSSRSPATMPWTMIQWLKNLPTCLTTSQVLQIKLGVSYTS